MHSQHDVCNYHSMKHRHTNYSVVIVVFAVMVFRFPGLRSVLGVLRVFCRVWGSESGVWDSYLSHAMLCLQSGAHETPCTFVIFFFCRSLRQFSICNSRPSCCNCSCMTLLCTTTDKCSCYHDTFVAALFVLAFPSTFVVLIADSNTPLSLVFCSFLLWY